MNSWQALKADTYRQYGRFSLWLVVEGAFRSRLFRVLVVSRICQGLSNSSLPLKILFPFFRVLHQACCYWACVDFPWETKMGGGIALTHGWGLVVTPGATIGNNVTLFHGVTLGRRDRISRTGDRTIEYPTLEDDVWVGPNAIIVGGITVGRGSRIAGGTFVTENIPPYSIVAGNPSVIVKDNCIPDVMNPAPIEDILKS